MRALVAAVLMVLGLATSASAECAWVLWEQTLEWNQAPRPGVKLLSAHATANECAQELDIWEKGRTVKRFNRTTLHIHEADDSISALKCLPDTVDPRGPKGK